MGAGDVTSSRSRYKDFIQSAARFYGGSLVNPRAADDIYSSAESFSKGSAGFGSKKKGRKKSSKKKK